MEEARENSMDLLPECRNRSTAELKSDKSHHNADILGDLAPKHPRQPPVVELFPEQNRSSLAIVRSDPVTSIG